MECEFALLKGKDMLKNLMTTAALLLSLTTIVLALLPSVEVPVEVMSGIYISLGAYGAYFSYFEEL